MEPIITAALIGAAGAVAAPIVARYLPGRKGRSKLPKYRASIVLAGLGNTGKSTLIENLLPGVDARAGTVTKVAAAYDETRSVHGEDDEYCEVLLVDYKGQDAAQLTVYLNREEFKTNPPTALVLLVDAFEEAEPDANRQPDKERVQQHLSQWSSVAIQSIAGILNEISYCCLFVNKIDALDSEARAKVSEEFSGIQEAMESSFSHITFEVLKGSALMQTGLSDLEKRILGSKKQVNR